MNAVARVITALFGLAMVIYPIALHATPVVATLAALAALLSALALLYPRRLSGGPAVLVVAVAYVAALATRGETDLLAPLPAAAAFLFVEGVSVCGLLASGAAVERDVVARRVRTAFLTAVAAGLLGTAVLALSAATDGGEALGFLVATAACGLLLGMGAVSRPAQSGPKSQDGP